MSDAAKVNDDLQYNFRTRSLVSSRHSRQTTKLEMLLVLHGLYTFAHGFQLEVHAATLGTANLTNLPSVVCLFEKRLGQGHAMPREVRHVSAGLAVNCQFARE